MYFANERPLVPRSLTALEERLDPAMFFRAGRKHIVNLKWVERVEPGIGGNLVIRLAWRDDRGDVEAAIGAFSGSARAVNRAAGVWYATAR